MKKIFLSISLLSLAAQVFAIDPFVGEYEGRVETKGHFFTVNPKMQAQVSKPDADTYQVLLLPYTLRRATPYMTAIIKDAGAEKLVIENPEGGYKITGEITKDGVMVLKGIAGKDEFTATLKKFERDIPSMGRKAPEGAQLLIGNGNMDAWVYADESVCTWKILGDTVEVPIEEPAKGQKRKNLTVWSKEKFKSFTLHLEFKLPESYGKAWGNRGNSGLYIGPIEIQIIDSFHLIGTWNECGALYKFMPPQVNAALPPERWQTYDVVFTEPKFEGGEISEYPRITVWHNGVKIHDEIEMTQGTDHSQLRAEESVKEFVKEGLKLSLQDHGDRLQFRNMWILPKKG